MKCGWKCHVGKIELCKEQNAFLQTVFNTTFLSILVVYTLFHILPQAEAGETNTVCNSHYMK